MIAIFVSCLLFIIGLVCTLSTVRPPAKIKFLPLWLQSFQAQPKFTNHDKTPSRDGSATKIISSSSSSNRRSNRVELKNLFATFDRNNDGFITRQELKESLRNIGISAGEGDVADMVEKVDSNGDGLIDLGEFCNLFDLISGPCAGEGCLGEDGRSDGDLREAFDVFDENKNGLITVDELGLVLSSLGFTQGKKLEDCKEMIRKVDVDGDGMVNFDEFKLMMKDGLKRIIPLPSE